MATDVTMFSPYLAALANPETIPRMSGESVADAQARVQAMQDELVARQSNRGVDTSAIDWQQSPSALNAANPTVQTQADYDYWTDRVNKGNAAMPGMGGDLAATQAAISSMMPGAPANFATNDEIMAAQAKEQADLAAARDAARKIAGSNDFVVTNPGDPQPADLYAALTASLNGASTSPFVTGGGSGGSTAGTGTNSTFPFVTGGGSGSTGSGSSGGGAYSPFVTGPGGVPNYDTSNFLTTSTSPFVTGPGSSSTPTAPTIAAVAPNSQGRLGAGNANYKSALIRSLRQSSVVPFSSNPGVDFYANRGTESSNWTPPVGMGSAFNPQVFNPRAATPQEVNDWNAYSAYRANQVAESHPYSSFSDWLANRG